MSWFFDPTLSSAPLLATPEPLPASAALTASATLTAPATELSSSFSSPNATISDGGWTTHLGGSDLHTAIDESAASDTDYIQSPSSPAGEMCEVSFNVPQPSSWPARVRYRAKADGSGIITVRLMEGASQRAFWSRSLGATYQDYEEVLTESEYNSVTDWSNVRLRFEAA